MNVIDPTKLLFAAIARDDPAAVDRLLDQGVAPDTRDGTDWDQPALIAALRKQTTLLYEHGPHERPKRFYHYAPSLPIMQALLRRGAPPDGFNDIGQTALTLAAQHHLLDSIELLLRYGAAIDQPDTRGTTPLMWSVIMRSRDGRDLMATTLLLDHGAALEATNDQGLTALHYAIANNRVAHLALLLARGADLQHADARGRTPLALVQHRASGEQAAMLDLLHLYGAVE